MSLAQELVHQKAAEVGDYVRHRYRRTVPKQDRDDVYQEAVLWALEWAARYGEEFEGDNPFTVMSSVAFSRVKTAVRRAAHASNVTEHGVRNGAELAARVPVVGCGYADRFDEGGGEVAVEIAGAVPAPLPTMRAEVDRRRSVAILFYRLSRKERLLVRRALEARQGFALRDEAQRCKVSLQQAGQVLRRLVAAVGPDESVAHLRLLVRDRRLPGDDVVVSRRGCELRIRPGDFVYGGRSYPSISASARAAARDLGLYSKAVNGYAFWGLGKKKAA